MMTNLTKGQEFNLSQNNPDLRSVFVGIGWDVNEENEASFDLDASAFLLGENGLVEDSTGFIFYNNLKHPSGAVTHSGDNRTGTGEGDDEAITVDFSLVPESIEKIAFAVSIYEAFERKQTFGQVKNAFIRCYDEDAGEICRFDLGEEFETDTAIVFGELAKKDGEWVFRAVGEGFQGGIIAMARRFGVFRK